MPTFIALLKCAPRKMKQILSLSSIRGLQAALILILTASLAPLATAQNADPDNSGWSASIAEGLDNTDLTDDQKQRVIQINTYLNQLTDLKGRFLQINPDDGQQKGKFYLKRPGRIRFDYSPPSLQVVISDGRYLSIEDRDINTVDRFPLEKTPFRIILAENVHLLRDAHIKALIETDDQTSIILLDRKDNAIGQIELVFTKEPVFELSEWKIVDAQGQTTRVILSHLNFDEIIAGKLFSLENNTESFFNR